MNLDRTSTIMCPMNPYEAFSQDVQRCMRCPLARTRNSVVISRGNPQADLAFIGEAPGYNEDLEGVPFVGKSGRLLDDMLKEFGLTEEDFVIYNVLKCRPPENEFPTGGIVKKCLPLLDKQMELVDPKVVILVGSKAAHYVVWRSYPGAPKMEDLHGRWIWSQAQPHIEFLAMYHPAYLLRIEGRNPRDFDRHYDKALDIIEYALDLLEGKQPPMEPLVVGSRFLIDREREKRDRTRS